MYRKERISRHVVFALIPLVLIALNVAYAEFAEDPPVYLRQWAVPSPSGAAFDSLRNIYVVDRNHKLLKKSDYLGMSITEWASCGLSNISQCTVPYDIALDSSDNMYVIDTNGIAKFDYNGKFIKRFGLKGSFGSGIAVHSSVDSSGNPFTNVYVANSQSHSVQKFSADGTLLTQWGRFGTATGQFRYPYDVAVDADGNVYVADSYNQRIQKFDSSGNFLVQWPSVYAAGVAVDALNNIYVISWSNCSIQKFTPEGILLTQWGSCGGEEGKFTSPFRINISPAGEIYVSDTGNNRIQVFRQASNDKDDDGISDDIDNCPQISNPDQSDFDNDGAGDACDNCPNDPNKTGPGICGCGIPDTDTDGDGTADCHDNCPSDPLKINPGICGCGVPDTDSDGDGTPNCKDACPNDANKIQPGVCGCGIPDINSDRDGILDCKDNCPQIENRDQADNDADGIGDECDPCDNRPITGTISPSKDILWPPNHRMVTVHIDASGLMPYKPTAEIKISSVTITERDKQGRIICSKNSFEPDFEKSGDLRLNLRSERTGTAMKRTYMITVTAEDCSGKYNFTTEVTVPHDKGK